MIEYVSSLLSVLKGLSGIQQADDSNCSDI